MTNEEIDVLSGTLLNEAVARQLGWTQPIPRVLPNVWDDEDGDSLELTFVSDIGAAMGLMLRLDIDECGWSISHATDGFSVHSELDGAPLTSGTKEQAATLLCRAYLKLKSR